MLKQDINTRRLDLLAASPPFVLALEQALVTVVSVEKAASLGAVAKRTRSAAHQYSIPQYPFGQIFKGHFLHSNEHLSPE